MAHKNTYQLEKDKQLLDEALDREELLIVFATACEAIAHRFRLYRARTADREFNDAMAKSLDPEAADFASPYDLLLFRVEERDDKRWQVRITLELGAGMEILDPKTGEKIDVG